MRSLSLIFILACSMNIVAQSAAFDRLFLDGTKYAGQERFAEALRSYKTALSAAENEQLSTGVRARLHYNVGVCHFRLGRYADAIPQFKLAILLKTDYVRAYYALGMAQAREKQWKAARASFERVVAKDPANGEAWFDLAFSSLALGDVATARSAFELSIELGSVDSALSHNNIGVILAMKGELAAAEERFENAISISGGRLFEAKHNLEFCRVRRAGRPELIAKEFLYSERDVTIRIS